MPPPPLIRGTVLKTHLHWLEKHAERTDEGVLVCAHSDPKERIENRVEHRVRLARERGLDIPFRPDMEPGDGTQISFTAYWCPHCNERPAVPKSVWSRDIINV